MQSRSIWNTRKLIKYAVVLEPLSSEYNIESRRIWSEFDFASLDRICLADKKSVLRIQNYLSMDAFWASAGQQRPCLGKRHEIKNIKTFIIRVQWKWWTLFENELWRKIKNIGAYLSSVLEWNLSYINAEARGRSW